MTSGTSSLRDSSSGGVASTPSLTLTHAKPDGATGADDDVISHDISSDDAVVNVTKNQMSLQSNNSPQKVTTDWREVKSK
ncbi:unnamed protein product, partial [Oppiella nova]